MKKAAALCILAVTACAQPPEAIAPAYVPDITYRALSCAELSEERARVDVALAAASGQQVQARSNDVAGVIFLGLPMGSMSGQNVAPQIAQLKGTQEALQRSWVRARCDQPQDPGPRY